MDPHHSALIERGRAELARFAAMLLAVIGGPMSPRIYRAALRHLRPLESALRRLIVVAARDIELRPPAVSVMPMGGIPVGEGARIGAFPLFDRRKRFDVSAAQITGAGPRIRSFDAPAAFEAAPAEAIDPARLRARMARVTRALARIKAEARRLALWRRRHPASLKIPMRPGRPPGYAARAKRDAIQFWLKYLDVSARIALEPG